MNIAEIFQNSDTRPYIIAEIGFNHAGDMNLACRMIEEAAQAGADAVKFQTFKAADLALPSSDHYALIASGELDQRHHEILSTAAQKADVAFLSTPFSTEAVGMLDEIGVPAFKIASMDLTNHIMLMRVAKTGKPVLLSTGMCNLAEIDAAVKVLHSQGADKVVLMHCLSKYPAQATDLNLRALSVLSESFHLPTGYSDHYPGVSACLAAGLLGARVIETHFTLDTDTPGGDHAHSADPQMLRKLVADLKHFGQMLGGKRFFQQRPDREYQSTFRRGLFAARDLPSGHLLTEKDVLTCRPATELGPNNLVTFVGQPLKREVNAHEAITTNHFQE